MSPIQGSQGTREQERQRPVLLSRTEGPGKDLGEEQGPQKPPEAPRGQASRQSPSWQNQGLESPGRRFPPLS